MENVSRNFLRGSYEALKITQLNKSKLAFLKDKSLSCGVSNIYNKINGAKCLMKGRGVTSALFAKNKIILL